VASPGRRVAVGHGLSIVVPPGWLVSYHRFTSCSDPVERFSLVGRGQVLTVEERLSPVRAELSRRPAHFRVRRQPAPLECCALERPGWMVQFGDRGRAFYAYVYPRSGAAAVTLLRSLDSLRVA
jgi:hypothetical protein